MFERQAVILETVNKAIERLESGDLNKVIENLEKVKTFRKYSCMYTYICMHIKPVNK